MFVEEKAKGEVKELDAASQLLLAAANFLERHQLHQGDFCSSDRQRAKIGDNFALADWNDRPGRTKEEVIAKLRAVAFSS